MSDRDYELMREERDNALAECATLRTALSEAREKLAKVEARNAQLERWVRDEPGGEALLAAERGRRDAEGERDAARALLDADTERMAAQIDAGLSERVAKQTIEIHELKEKLSRVGALGDMAVLRAEELLRKSVEDAHPNWGPEIDRLLKDNAAIAGQRDAAIRVAEMLISAPLPQVRAAHPRCLLLNGGKRDARCERCRTIDAALPETP